MDTLTCALISQALTLADAGPATLTAHYEGSCAEIEVRIPGVIAVHGLLQGPDGRVRAIDPLRAEHRWSSVVVHLPELAEGGAATLTLTVARAQEDAVRIPALGPAPIDVRAPRGAALLGLEAVGKRDLHADISPPWLVAARVVASSPIAAPAWCLRRDDLAVTLDAALIASVNAASDLDLTPHTDIPGPPVACDPAEAVPHVQDAPDALWIAALLPEGVHPGSALGRGLGRLDHSATWSHLPADRPSLLTLPVQDGDSWTVHWADGAPEGVAVQRGPWLRVLVPAGAGSVRVGWRRELIDAWGTLPWSGVSDVRLAVGALASDVPPGDAFERVTAGGEAHHDAFAWWVSQAGGVRLALDPARIREELSRQLVAASYPEPALPQRWRGLELEQALPRLHDLLQERVWVRPDPREPFRVRSLSAAQASAAATPLEAATILARWAGQLRLPAEVVLAGPAEAAADATPARFTRPLVRIAAADVVWWLDPLCPTCAPGTVDPSWVGAALFGGGVVSQGSVLATP